MHKNNEFLSKKIATDLFGLLKCTIINSYFCDSWIAPNSLGIYNIVGHFIDKEKTLQALLLEFIEIKKVHSREKLATHMLIVLDEYHI